MKANLKSLEECRQLKKYERSEYWVLRKKGIQPLPWEFGCPDWSHDETGAVNCWIPPDPDAVLLDDGIPFEEQHYQAEKEDTQWDNMQHGWSKMVDQGVINDYWKNYQAWN